MTGNDNDENDSDGNNDPRATRRLEPKVKRRKSGTINYEVYCGNHRCGVVLQLEFCHYLRTFVLALINFINISFTLVQSS